MPNGDPFSQGQLDEVSRIVTQASRETGLHFSVFVGSVDGSVHDYAERLHAALGDVAPDAVLICVAPGERQVDVVTGRRSARRLGDRACALATLAMTSAFTGGDLVGGVVNGVRMLADAAGREREPSR